MKNTFDREKAYKCGNYRDMLNYIEKIKNGEIPFELILIDNVYVFVHFGPQYTLSLGPLTKVRTDSNNMGNDVQMVLYPDFFKLPDINTKIYLLAHDIGRFKTSNLRIPQYGVEQRKAEWLKVGKTIEEELAADRYAAKVIPNKVKVTMLTIANYIEHNMQWDEGALDMRLRAYQQAAV